ncbi:MAG: MMPL family transporter, partial [Candidatus Nitrotoga sp.]
VQELAITASMGVLLMIVTNKLLLPVLLSYLRLSDAEKQKNSRTGFMTDNIWRALSHFAQPRAAIWVLLISGVILVLGTWQARELKIGDLGKGIPELHDTSRYNRDNAAITDNFSIGVDVLSVIAQSHDVQGACTNYDIMDNIDRLQWHLRHTDGVQSVLSLPGMAKIINAGWNEGSLKWRALSRDSTVLAQSVTPIDTSSGLLNADCSAMQIMIFTRDHQGETIAHIVSEIKKFASQNNTAQITFLLASGNVGVMAATNEAVAAAEMTMLLSIFGAIILLCLITFRSWQAALCIVVPLALVSVLCNALMALLDIGLKVSTLPVVALGVGVGVDYGIYLFERIKHEMQTHSLSEAFYQALKQRGTAAIFTALTMSIGVGSWVFSALKFQSDMGILLAFMFLVNMLGAILLLPALAAYLIKPSAKIESVT